MNYKTVSKPMVKGIDISRTNDYKAKIMNLLTKISSLFTIKKDNKQTNRYRYVNNDRSIELISMVSFYSNRYHSML